MVSRRQAGDHAEQFNSFNMLTPLRGESMAPGEAPENATQRSTGASFASLGPAPAIYETSFVKPDVFVIFSSRILTVGGRGSLNHLFGIVPSGNVAIMQTFEGRHHSP